MIDWAQVEELRDAVGADEFDDLVVVFLDEVEGVLEPLTLSDGPENLERQLHFLKGSALNLGFADFASMCQAGETAARAGETDSIDIAQLKATYGATKQAFMAEIATRYAA